MIEICYEHLLTNSQPEVVQTLLEEDELRALAQYHLEKFKNWMRPLMDPDAISSEITIQMPPVKLPASKK